MTFRDRILPKLDKVRGKGARLGLRPFTVSVRVTTWSGTRPGEGTPTYLTTPLKVNAGASDPIVAHVSSRDILASNGKQRDQDLRVGPLTPTQSGGGVSDDALDPAMGASPTEIKYLVTGPGLPAGALFDRVDDENESALHRYVIIRQTGQVG